MAPVSSTSIPSQHKETYMPPQPVIPPQPSTPQLPSPNNTHHQQQYRQPSGTPHISPIRQPRQQSPLRTQINPSVQHFIPAAVAHQTVSGSSGQGTSKSVNGEGVKNSRQQGKSSASDECFCYQCKQPGHLKKDFPELPYCSKCRTRGHIPARCPTK